MVRPFYRTSGIKNIPKFDFVSPISGVRRMISKCKVCAFKLMISKYAYEVKRLDILSLRSSVYSKGGTFLRHPVENCVFFPSLFFGRKRFFTRKCTFFLITKVFVVKFVEENVIRESLCLSFRDFSSRKTFCPRKFLPLKYFE